MNYYNEIDSTCHAYVITNTTNGKVYVGVTVQGLRRRWCAHLRAARGGVSTALYASIRKHGVDAFEICHVASSFSRHALKQLERELIKQYDSMAPKGYNLTLGGDGVNGLPAYIVKRTAEKNRGRKHTQEARRLIGEASKGHPVTDEMRSAIGTARRGKPLSAVHKAKLSAAKIGKKLPPRSIEHRERISAGLILAHARRSAK